MYVCMGVWVFYLSNYNTTLFYDGPGDVREIKTVGDDCEEIFLLVRGMILCRLTKTLKLVAPIEEVV